MAKSGTRSTTTPNVASNRGGGAAATSTHPDTRVVQTFPNQQGGKVTPTTAPLPTIADMESRRQKPHSPVVPVVGQFDTETTEAARAHLPTPVGPDVAVPTERTYDQGEDLGGTDKE